MNNNIKYVYNFINNKYVTILGVIFILFYKNGFSNMYNGLPFSNKYETITFLIILPIIVLFKVNIFKDKKFKYIILTLVIIKLLLISTQFTNGFAHKIIKYNDNSLNVIRTYSSFWFNNISDIQESNWDIKKKFPLDWMNYDKSFGTAGGKTVESTEKYKSIQLTDNVRTFLITNENKNLIFDFKGLTNNSFLVIKGKDKNYFKKIILSNGLNDIFIEKGKYELSFTLNFKGEKWAFNLIETNKLFKLSDFRYFSVVEPLIKTNLINLFVIIGFIYEIIIICLILYSFFYTFKNISNNKSFLLFFLHPLNLFICFYILKLVEIDDQTGFWTISLSFIFLFLIYLINFRLRLNKKEIDNLFFSIFTTSLLYCSYVFHYNLEITFFWTAGDDWVIFHEYARKIVIENEWIRAGEDVYYYRPGIRYVFAFFHLIFGNPSFAIQFIDIWSILLVTYLSYLILLKSNLNSHTSFLLSLTIPIIIFGESFRWLIGRGLTEFFGSFILILSTYLIYKNNLRINIKFMLICFLIILSAWLREEKFLAAISIILLSKLFIIKYNFLYDILNFIFLNFKIIILYCIIILIGFPILFILRNYIYSDNLTALDNPVFLNFGIKSLYTIVMGVTHIEYPRLIGLINTPAFIISFLIIVNAKFYRYLNNIGFPIIILMLTLPTLIFEIPGYIPRHSLYLIPFSIIINSILLFKIYKSLKNNFN